MLTSFSDPKCVIAIGGQILHDSYQTIAGYNFPGIEANRELARNILSYMRGHLSAPGMPRKLDGDDWCARIEINLSDFVRTVLEHHSSEWWEKYVPLSIRQECAKGQEEDDNQIRDRWAYLFFIGLKTIIDKNWKLFEPHFQKINKGIKKADAIGWMDEINRKYRRMAGHPIKRHVSAFDR